MKRLLKVISMVVMMAVIFSVMPITAMATTTTTTTGAASTKLSLKGLTAVGSNQKSYLCSPNYSDSTDNYSFNVPDWMPSLTVRITAQSGLSCSSSSVSFTENSGIYTGTFELADKTQSFSVKLTSTSGQSRTLKITVRRSTIECYFDKVIIRQNDADVTADSGTVNEGLTFKLPSGTTTCEIRMTPRHENELYFENTTVKADGSRVVDATTAKEKVELNYYRYTVNPTLIEGTNTFVATINAGSVTKTCNITVIVGDPAANSAAGTTPSATVPTPTQPGSTATNYGCSINGTTMTLTNALTGATTTYYRSDGTSSESIFGTWSASDGSSTMVFYADNTCLVNGLSNTYTLNGTALTIEPVTTITNEDTGTLPTTAPTTAAQGGLSELGGMSPLMWVLIGIIITVVLGACIFMIVNMSGGNKNQMQDDYYEEPLYRDTRRRRNLADFAVDDYDDYDDYGYQSRGSRGYGGRPRNNASFDDYDDYDDYGRY